jgi:hypothetical protein
MKPHVVVLVENVHTGEIIRFQNNSPQTAEVYFEAPKHYKIYTEGNTPKNEQPTTNTDTTPLSAEYVHRAVAANSTPDAPREVEPAKHYDPDVCCSPAATG